MQAKLPLFLAIFAGVVVASFAVFYQSRNAQNYARGVLQSPTKVLATTAGLTNIALLGVGGQGHEGGELTDSILLASINHTNNQLTLISIPRDLYLTSQRAKINSIYYYGEKAEPGTGLAKLSTALTLVTGLPIHYSLLIDFNGFIKAVDAVGGIEVNVDRAFDDYKYPIPGQENAVPESARYEHLHFDAGPQKMDGVTALKYVRSRHALGEEGTDFARSARQQKVIKAFISSLVSTKTVFNPERQSALKSSIASSIKTDIPDSHLPAFTKLMLSLNFDSLKTLSLETELYNPKNLAPYGGAWVLLPKTSWDSIHQYVVNNL